MDTIDTFVITPYLFFILMSLTLIFLMDSCADFLNMSYLTKKLPEEFAGTYDAGKYTEYLKYQSDRVRFGGIHRALSFMVTIGFIVAGGFNAVDLFARSFSSPSSGSLTSGLIFVATLGVLQLLFELPFSIYSTFFLEEKYGFNKTTPGVFLGDLFKGLILTVLLGAPLFAGIVTFFESAGTYAWLYSWIAITVLQLILLYLAPAFILPLFNRFTPLPEGELKAGIEAYSKANGFKLSGIFTMDGSKRSTKSNAFFTGFGRFRRLVLFDTLVEKQTVEELVAVFAHEVGHFKRMHILKYFIRSLFISAVGLYAFGFFMNDPELYKAFQMRQPSVYSGLVFISFLYAPFSRISSVFTQYLSRKYEFEADAFSKQTHGKPEALVSALKKLSVDNLAHLTPHPFKVALDYSHPPVMARIQALRE